MALKSIDAVMIQKMFLSGAKALEAKKEYINELNVFPVPDGDTGTNMTMTIMSAAKEVTSLEKPGMDELGKAISSGSLRGARGNSGVIMSQIFRGFVKEIKGNDTLDVNTIGNAVQHAAETAYKAVMKPKEGTILTVAKAGAEKAQDMLINSDTEDIIEFCDAVVACMEETLLKTPDMLPVLKQAGVVDSGGEGLMTFLRGAIDALKGKVSDFTVKVSGTSRVVKASTTATEEDIKFGYCTEFIIKLEKEYTDEDEAELKKYLGSIGDSLVVVSDDEIVKIHVHTNHPGLAFEKGLTYGSLSRMKIDNMREEHEERVIQDSERLAKEQAQADTVKQEEKEEPGERREYGFIAVSCGDGLSEIFKGIGADYLIEGGQTMNPSTEDMLNAIAHVNADHIFILPNNKNIILAANQARDLTEDKEIIVVPSKTVPQGITALVNFMPDLTSKENLENMTAEMERVKTAQITYAVRTTNIDGMEIEKGDIMAIGDKGMLAVEHSPEEAAKAALKAMLDEDSELVTIYYGCDVKEEDAEKLKEEAEKEFPDKELELQYGGQPIYYYMISAE